MATLTIDDLPIVQAIVSSFADPAYVVDRDMNLLWVNTAFQHTFNYKIRKRLPCHQVTRMGICGTAQCSLTRCVQLSPGQLLERVETNIAGAVESDASCVAGGFPLRHPETGEVVAMLGIMRDNSVEVKLYKWYQESIEAERNRKEILEKMVAERTAELVATNDTLNTANLDLERSRREIAEILENISQGIITIDDKLQVGREYSKHSELIFGRDELAGLSLPELLAPADDDAHRRKDLAEWLKLVFHSPSLDWKLAKSMTAPEYNLRRPDGKSTELRVDFEPIREDQRVRRIMVLIEDLTEKRELERAINAKEREMNENIEHLAELAKLDRELYDAVFEEAFEIIERSATSLRGIRDAADPGKVIDAMFRDMHTLKGNAMSYGMVRVAAKAHWVEDAFSGLRSSIGSLTEAVLSETEEKVRELGELFKRIQSMASRVLAQPEPDNGAVRAVGRPIKLEVEQQTIDELVGWIGTALADQALSAELIMRVRSLALVPIGRLYGRLPKMVDDLAETLGKHINPVALEGAEIGIDSKAFNRIGNAIIHIMRNAIDHGIEPPELRLRNGKSAPGTIAIKTYYAGDRLRIDVSDDGGGISGEKLVEIARKKGVLGPDEHPTGQAAIDLIFRPGFSTAAATTDISGRGVGMDAVKALLAELSGDVEIKTEVGRGTTFRLWIPTAVAVGDVAPQ